MDELLEKQALHDGQRVLALTFMHGSRLRLSHRLQQSRARGRFECTTFDGFAHQLCRRWRTYLAAAGVPIPPDTDKDHYEAICAAAAALLDNPLVVRWVVSTYPLVLVDEFQDCYGARPQFLERLASLADVLAAADPFQDLKTTGVNPAMAMLAAAGVPGEELSKVHRTSVPALLAGATALREGLRLEAGVGLAVEGVPSHHLAAAKVCGVIAKLGKASAAIIAAERPTPSSFAWKVLDAAANTKGYGPQKSLGPYTVSWESSADVHRDNLLAMLEIDDSQRLSAHALAGRFPDSNPLTRLMVDWFARERRLRGRSEFAPSEVRAQVGRAEATYRALPRRSRGLRALTIHQAKNREFDRVVVLWGFGLPGDPEMQRRLLYNAITRARASALVLVIDPKNKRLKEPPFA
jgi:hypothetical protein